MMGTISISQYNVINRPLDSDNRDPFDGLCIEPAAEPLLDDDDVIVQPPQFRRVYLSTSTGFSGHGLLRSVSRIGVQVLAPMPVPTRCDLQITIAGCRPTCGEAFYCRKQSSVHKVGIVFGSIPKPAVSTGAVAEIQMLDAPLSVGRGNIVEVGRSSLSILGKVAIPAGAPVRIESSGWILFGVVKERIATSMKGGYLQIHLQAAFPEDSAEQASPTSIVSIVEQDALAILGEPAGGEGASL
jgi:hypothetical protein